MNMKSSDKITCPVCGELKKSRDELKKHMKSHGMDEKLSCMAMGDFYINPLESPKVFGIKRNLMGTGIVFLLVLLVVLLLYIMQI